MFLELEAMNKCKEYQKKIETEEQIKRKNYIISGDLYLMIKKLIDGDRQNMEFYIGIIKGLLLAQGIQEINKIKI